MAKPENFTEDCKGKILGVQTSNQVQSLQYYDNDSASDSNTYEGYKYW